MAIAGALTDRCGGRAMDVRRCLNYPAIVTASVSCAADGLGAPVAAALISRLTNNRYVTSLALLCFFFYVRCSFFWSVCLAESGCWETPIASPLIKGTSSNSWNTNKCYQNDVPLLSLVTKAIKKCLREIMLYFSHLIHCYYNYLSRLLPWKRRVESTKGWGKTIFMSDVHKVLLTCIYLHMLEDI